jgi:hypothetical protein|tara:strand:+ start:79 stop:714 length:636 start_codon:yes stop_codon:yes gene_type:complete
MNLKKGIYVMTTQTIADLCELRLQYFKLEGNYARLRRETEMKITELHIKALEYKLPLGLSYDDVNPVPKRRDVFSDWPDKANDRLDVAIEKLAAYMDISHPDKENELTDPKSPIWTRPDEALHTFSGEGDREATVHFNGDFYYVKLYEYGKLLDTRNLETKSERYAEDCAENWVLSIFQIKKTAADNASTEGHGLRDWERSWLKEGPPKTE